MKKSILLVAVLMALVSLCLVLASCDSGSSDSSDPTPPPEPTYTISFAAGEGTGSMEPVTVEKGASYTIKANGFTAPAGTLRSFAGWNTKADGSGTAYAAGATIESVTANITLYAQWTKPSFSVSTTEKVYFSKGNLYYNGSAFKFEDNQYNFHGYDSATNTWGLFGWSTDGVTTPSANYKPWGINNSTNTSDYSGLFVDWGGIESLPGNSSTTKVWRTLSSAEWDYLLKTRSDANRFAKANVNGVKGLLIFPDEYNGGNLIGTVTGVATVNDDTAELPGTSIDDDTWTAMENAGVVFLPAADYRNGSSVNNVGSSGYYWSATAYDDSDTNAYYLIFNGYVMAPDFNGGRSYGQSVRLVVGE